MKGFLQHFIEQTELAQINYKNYKDWSKAKKNILARLDKATPIQD